MGTKKNSHNKHVVGCEEMPCSNGGGVLVLATSFPHMVLPYMDVCTAVRWLCTRKELAQLLRNTDIYRFMNPPLWTPHAKAAMHLARGVHGGTRVLEWSPARGTVRSMCTLEDGRVLLVCNFPEYPRVLLPNGTLHVLRCSALARVLHTATSAVAWDGELVVAHGARVSWFDTEKWKGETIPLVSQERKVQKLCCFDPRSPLFALCGSHAYMMLPGTRVFRMVMSCCSAIDVTPCKNGWVARHACIHDSRTCVARYRWQSADGMGGHLLKETTSPCMMVDRVKHATIKTAVLPMLVRITLSGDVVIVRVDGSLQLLDRDDWTSSIVLPMRVKLPHFRIVGDVIFGSSECFDTGFCREERVRLATRAWGGKGQRSLALQALLRAAHHRDGHNHPCTHPYRNLYAVAPHRGLVVDRQGDHDAIHVLW